MKIEDLRNHNVYEVLLHMKISEILSVYIHCMIHTFSRSKSVNITVTNIVNCQTDTLLKILRNVFIEVSLIFRIFNQNKIYNINNYEKDL